MGPRHEGRGRHDEAQASHDGQGGRINGATPRGGWKTTMVQAPTGSITLLQWGHATRGVEDRVAGLNLADRLEASMGPRHEGRGRRYTACLLTNTASASMGPRHEG